MTGLGGTWIDDDGKTVRLYWKGAVPDEMETLLADVRADGTPVAVIAARYSAAELMAEASRIADLKPAQVDGVQITGAGPRNDYSGLDVRIAKAEDLSRARQRITSKIPLLLTVRRQAGEAASRWDDSPPFWGGAAVDRSCGLGCHTYCTTGFAVWNSAGIEGLITARHCGQNVNWYTPLGDRLVGGTGSGNASIDTGLIRGQDYGPTIYIGAWDSSSGRAVGTSGDPSINSLIFVNGSWGGYVVVRVVSVGQYETVNGVKRGPGFWTLDEAGTGSVGEGDSGGPVGNNYNNFTRVIARGMIDLIDLDSLSGTCTGRLTSPCSTRAFHVNIRAILTNAQLTLQTL